MMDRKVCKSGRSFCDMAIGIMEWRRCRKLWNKARVAGKKLGRVSEEWQNNGSRKEFNSCYSRVSATVISTLNVSRRNEQVRQNEVRKNVQAGIPHTGTSFFRVRYTVLHQALAKRYRADKCRHISSKNTGSVYIDQDTCAQDEGGRGGAWNDESQDLVDKHSNLPFQKRVSCGDGGECMQVAVDVGSLFSFIRSIHRGACYKEREG